MKKSKLGLLFLSSLALVTGVASTGVAGVLANQSSVSVVKAEDDSFELSNGVYSGSETSGQIVWSGTAASITQTKGSSSSNVSSSYVSAPRWYASHVIAFAANAGYTITGASVVCTSASYATALANSTYSTGASASASDSTVTITSSGDFTITMGAQSRIYEVTVRYRVQESSTNVTLPEGCQDDLNGINPYFGLAYKYDKTVTSCMSDGDAMAISGQSASSDFSSAVTSAGTFASQKQTINSKSYTATFVLPSYVSYNDSSKLYHGKNNTMKMGTTSSMGTVTFDSTKHLQRIEVSTTDTSGELVVKAGENEVECKSKSTSSSTITYIFDLANVDTVTLQTKLTNKPVWVKTLKFFYEDSTSTFADVDFRLRVATDNMSSLTTKYSTLSEYGVEIKTSTKTALFAYSSSTYTDVDENEKSYQFVVIDLGDAINVDDGARLSEEFTATPYVKLGDDIAYSLNEKGFKNSKTYSVKSLVSEYHSMERYTSSVDGLYSYFVKIGLIG